MKRGQITIFLIIGLILIITIMGSLYLFNSSAERMADKALEDVSKSKEMPTLKTYVETCMDSLSDYYVREIALLGGSLDRQNNSYVQYPQKIGNKYIKNDYRALCYQIGYEGCINTVTSVDDMELELQNQILDNMTRCVNLTIFENLGYDVKNGSMSIDVSIAVDDVTVNLEYPVEISIRKDVQNIEEYQSLIRLPLGKYFDLALDIVNTELTNGRFDHERFMVDYYTKNSDKLFITKNKPYPHTIYSLSQQKDYFEEVPFSFRFSIQGEDTVSQLGYESFGGDIPEDLGCCKIYTHNEDYCYKNVPAMFCSQKSGIFYNSPCTCDFDTYSDDVFAIPTCEGALCKMCEKTWDPDLDNLSGPPRKHGESWCVYDSITNRGMDYVGSRHFKHFCIDGVEYSEECRDFREELCTQYDFGGYTHATCRINRWQDCVDCETQECCENENLRDCFWGKTDFPLMEKGCHPVVSPGFRFWEGNGVEVCNEGNAKLTVNYKEEDPNWLNENAMLCTRMGDCGDYRTILDWRSSNGFFHTFQKYEVNETYIYNPDGYNINFRHLEKKFDINYSSSVLKSYQKQTSVIMTLFSEVMNFLDSLLNLNPIDFLNPFGEPDVDVTHHTICGVFNLPSKDDECRLCDDDPYKPCSEYRCMSLGRKCLFDANNNTCFENTYDDDEAPEINLDNTTLSIYTLNSSELEVGEEIYYGWTILPYVKPYNVLQLKLDSNEPTQCKFDFLPAFMPVDDDYMPALWFGDMSFNETHEISIRIPPHISVPEKLLDLMELGDIRDFINWFLIPEQKMDEMKEKYSGLFNTYQALTGKDLIDDAYRWLDKFLDFKVVYQTILPFMEHLFNTVLEQFNNNGYYLFVKCTDYAGNVNEDERFIAFQISDIKDVDAPIVVDTEPDNPVEVIYGTNFTEIIVYTNEPSECRYSTTDENFLLMDGVMECVSSPFLVSPAAYGSYECRATFDIRTDDQFFIRCRDQPVITNKYILNLFKGSRFGVFGAPHPFYYNISEPKSIYVVDSVLTDENTKYIVNTSVIDFGIFTNEKLECRYSNNESKWFVEMTDKFDDCEMSGEVDKGVYVCKEKLDLEDGFKPESTTTEENYTMMFKFDYANWLDDPAKRNAIVFDENTINVLRTSALIGEETIININNSYIELKLSMFGKADCRWGETLTEFDSLPEYMNCNFNDEATVCDDQIRIPMNNYKIYTACRNLFGEEAGNNSIFYIHCREFNATPELDRNVNNQSYLLNISRIPTWELDIGPNGTITNPNFNLTIQMNRNITENSIICGYNWEPNNGYMSMTKISDYEYKRIYANVNVGDYTAYIMCTDSKGQEIYSTTSFEIVY